MSTDQRPSITLASALVIAASMAFAALVNAQSAGVTFWNKLDGGTADVPSEIGPSLNYYDSVVDGPGDVGSVTFAPGRFGNAATLGPRDYYQMARVRALVLRDLRNVLNPERGTIAVWYKEKERPVPYEHNNYLIFGGGFDLFPPVQFQNSFDGVNPNTLQFIIQFGGERQLVDALFSPPLNEWVHVAAVWDRRGIDGTSETVRLYVNGNRVGATTANAWGTGFESNNVDIAGGNDLIQDKFALDNMVVYDYAKTDFSDRFNEEPRGRATAWGTARASTTDEIIEALLTATRTGMPTTVVVAPGRYNFVQSFDTGMGPSLLPPIKTTVHVVGAGAATTILDGSGAYGRIFTVAKGGALVVLNMTLTHGGFTADHVSIGGGVAANYGGSLRLDDCLLMANGTGAEGGAFGGAVLSKNGRLHLERVTLMNNTIWGSGGAVAILGGSGIIRDSIVSGNKAWEIGGTAAGGGIYVEGATLTIGGSTVSGNLANRLGGGLVSFGGTIWLTDSAITENAASDPGHLSYGGGIVNTGLMRIKNGTVGANSAGTAGGGIYNGGRLFLRGATIVRNAVHGDFGGGRCDPELKPCFLGGGVRNAEGGTLSSSRSVLARNRIPIYDPVPPFNLVISVGPDCEGRLLSEGYNALGDASGCELQPSYVLNGRPTNDQVGLDPRLGEFQDSGEAGHAHYPLLDQSPLIDAGGPFPETCTKFDQVGQPRADGDADRKLECDIGAIEYQLP